MELSLQPKPEIEILPADRGIVSRKQFFLKKKFEKINKYFFSGHLIRHWKPKADLIYPSFADELTIQYECDFNRDVQNCFVEDYAEEVYLRTPPPCFVIIGKCGRSISELGREIAKEFGSVLIQVEDIVNQVIQKNTETSKILDRLLRLGVSLTLNFILTLISYVAHTPEARHRGYVLCGLPSAPLLHDLSVDQQFNYLLTWENKPTVFINVLFNDEDLIKERTNLLCEIKNAESEKFIFYHSENEGRTEAEDSADETDDDELVPVKENIFYERNIDISPSRPWIQLPRDEESRVWFELELFDNMIRPAIEVVSSRVDPQYFITVDSRVGNEFEVVLARLNILQIWKVPTARLFIQPRQNTELTEDEVEEAEKEEGSKEVEYDSDLNRIIGEPPEKAFLILLDKNTISPKFRWELSHYNYICPVSLREGEIVEGKSEFAVVFMKYIYFLRDKESATKFIQNPRAYVLPIRPKPLCRFFILGYPYSGKTTLAQNLADEFSIPIINFNTVLKNDLERKRNIYQEFCRQKAECREAIRLTSQAWQDWRMEEEQRLHLIEEWILFIQILLSRRIKEFYSSGSEDNASTEEIRHHRHHSISPVGGSGYSQVMPEDNFDSSENSECQDPELSLEIQDTVLPSEKAELMPSCSPAEVTSGFVKAVPSSKQKNLNFSEKSQEEEANEFLSSIWKSFSSEKPKDYSEKDSTKSTEEFGEYEGTDQFEFDEESNEYDLVDWCSLLPPQSLSSFLISKKPYTTRQKRQSFKIFLEAASKAYWAPSKLKSQFMKWRIPCFMDIPLCEIFLDNPMLLLKYVPEWLKERPLIPNPVDPTHPSILEAGRKALLRASCVVIKQNEEEMGVLLRDAIEKAEREGMRVTGEVISPGGWVVDDMTLDLKVWSKLASENIFADHIYILTDTELEMRRIINMWWDLCGQFKESNEDLVENEKNMSKENIAETEELPKQIHIHKNIPDTIAILQDKAGDYKSMVKHLIEKAKANAEGDEQLDAIYSALIFGAGDSKLSVPPCFLDPFCLDILATAIDTYKEESVNEEALLTILTSQFSDTIPTSGFFSHEEICPSSYDFSLGVQLEIFTNSLINKFNRKLKKDETSTLSNECLAKSSEFFTFLVSLPNKIYKLKEWLTAIGRDSTVDEIEMTDKSQDQVFFEIRKNLMKPFIKKPRELEIFEVEEIRKAIIQESRQIYLTKKETEDEDNETEDVEDEEDVRIFGESGKLCIVSLERGMFLFGKFEFALRYYGKLYFFSNQDAKKKFIEDPEKYAPYYSPIRSYPSLRIFVMGPTGSGKSVLAQSLANHFSIINVDYLQFIVQNLVPHLQLPSKRFTAVGDKKLLMAENHSPEAKLAKEHFMSMSYKKRLYWLESSFYSDFVDIENFFDKILQKAEPTVFKSFPELTYMNVESVTIENSDSFSNLPESLQPKINTALLETPYISMKETDAIITNYFQNKSDLGDFFLEKCLKVLWNKEPYITQGFVLEGFPVRSSEIQTLIKNNWIPDMVIEVRISEEDTINRNTDALMKFWDAKLKQEITEEKLIEDSLLSLQRTFLMLRRNELIKEIRAESIKALEGVSSTDETQLRTPKKEGNVDEEHNSLNGQKYDDLKIRKIFSKPSIKKYEVHSEKGSDLFEPLEKLDSLDVEEVEKILKEKFPSFTFNSVFENYDDAKARILSSLSQTYQADMSEIDKIKAALEDVDVSWVVIDGLQNLKEILRYLFLRLDTTKKRINTKGEFAFTVKMKMAEKLLEQGYYFLSKFGKWCPVQVYRMKNPIHMFRPFNAKGKVTPIVYRNYIYFVAGEYEKKIFLEDPIKFTFNEPHHPNIPLRIAVIGPPKSGKSTLCKRLKSMFDLKIVTMGSALRFALEKTPGSTLSKSIRSYLRRGSFLPLSLKIEALMVSLNDSSCVTQGFVFDGMPFDAAFTQSLAEKGKLPFVIISLVCDSNYGKTNRRNLDLKQFRLPYKNRTNLDSRYVDWNQTYQRFAQWNQDTYNNLYELNAKLNVVDIFYQAYDIIRKSFFGILYYVEYCVTDRALPLHYLCVSQHEYELRKSSFHNNCPVCWVELNRLNNSSDPPPRSGLVQYLNHFYWVCPKHMEKFLKNPKTYFPPNAQKWPELFPKMLPRHKLEKHLSQLKIHGLGRCPVTRTDFPSFLDWEGSYDFAAYYDKEVFLCKNKEMLDRFLAMPWRYCHADTKFEVNRSIKSNAVERLGPPKITSLPPIGFLEQTVADLIQECLQILGVVRPLYPNISPTVTGCTFVALYLKVYNKKNRNSHLEKRHLDFMLRHCHPNLFLVSTVRYPQYRQEIGQGDFEPDEAIESGSFTDYSSGSVVSEVKNPPSDPCWLDFESQTDRKMWSAAYLSDKFTAMKLTSEDDLIEIPEVPKTNVILKYQTYSLRSSPIPPISNCLTYIYTCKKGLEIPKSFNYNSLYQAAPLFSLPFAPEISFNPNKQFAMPLYVQNQSTASSKPDLRKGKRAVPDSITEKIKSDKEVDPATKLLTNDFFPRIQLIDKITEPDVPAVPKVVELEPLYFNPHRDYAYTVLFSEFFRTTHVLRCYEWSETLQYLEFSNRIDKNIALTKVQTNFIFKPQKPGCMKSRTSIDSYQKVFDAASKFIVSSQVQDLNFKIDLPNNETNKKSSLVNFLQQLILEKLEEMFEKISSFSLSYDAFEINVFPSNNSSNNKHNIIIREILPYPPLPWDIISRPYYSYCSISSIFQLPPLDNIAHKRHISLLDGLTELEDDFQFVPYPTQVQEKCEKNATERRDLKKNASTSFYFVYDFFNIPWTSFLTYPYSVACNMDITDDFSNEENQDSHKEKSETNLH